jgi:hypothetical protein
VCTLTWLRREDGYELFFSRDESLQRLPAHAPTRTRRNGVEILAPRDADAGGTWLAVNAWGLTLGLLNGPADGPQPPAPVSRGLLVSDLADAREADEVARRLAGRDLARHRPFELAALQPAAPLLRAVWDGRRLELSTLEDAAQPLCSSSLDPLGAGASRRALLERLRSEAGGLSEELLLGFHASHEPEPGGPSPCMHRDDAATVSFGRTRVTAGAVELGYSPAAPCARLPLTWLGLERLPAPGASSAGERGPARRAPGP